MSIQPVTKRILVCEDSDTVARLWVAVLEQSGYKVVGPLSSAEKALEEAYQDLPDLAIIDIGLRAYPSRLACSQAMIPHANWSIAL
jgi:DNA-binding response OmpR family regulator